MKKGFTLIEMIVSFAIVCIVTLALFRTVLSVQQKQASEVAYNSYIAFSYVLNNTIQNDFLTRGLVEITKNNTNDFTITYDDGEVALKVVDNYIIYDTTREAIPSGYSLYGELEFTSYTDNGSGINSYVMLTIPVKNDSSAASSDLKYIYQFDNTLAVMPPINGVDVTTLDPGVSAIVPIKSEFKEYSWSSINKLAKALNDGSLTVSELKDTYNIEIGDTKEVTLTDYGTFNLGLSNLETSESCSNSSYSTTTCGVVVEFMDIITTHAMNSTNTSVGSWKDSEMRTFLNTTIYNSLPDELKNIIIDTTVVTGHGKSDSSNVTTTDKLYLLSVKEIWGVTENDTLSDTTQTDNYSSLGVGDSFTNQKTYPVLQKNYNGVATSWWTRTPDDQDDDEFIRVGVNGDHADAKAKDLYGVAPAFRIGA